MKELDYESNDKEIEEAKKLVDDAEELRENLEKDNQKQLDEYEKELDKLNLQNDKLGTAFAKLDPLNAQNMRKKDNQELDDELDLLNDQIKAEDIQNNKNQGAGKNQNNPNNPNKEDEKINNLINDINQEIDDENRLRREINQLNEDAQRQKDIQNNNPNNNIQNNKKNNIQNKNIRQNQPKGGPKMSEAERAVVESARKIQENIDAIHQRELERQRREINRQKLNQANNVRKNNQRILEETKKAAKSINTNPKDIRATAKRRIDERNRIRREEERRQREEENRRREEERRRREEENRQREEERRQQEAVRQQDIRQRNNEYETKVNNVVQRGNDGYQAILAAYGPTPEVMRNMPQGLTPEIIAALMIGAAVDEDRLKDAVPNLIEEAGSVEKLQIKMIDTVLRGGNDNGNLTPLLIDSGRRVDNAINAYRTGDDTQIKNILKNYANFSAQTAYMWKAGDSAEHTGLEPYQMSYKFCKEVVMDGPFEVKPDLQVVTDISKKQFDSYVNQLKSLQSAENSKQRLINEASTLTLEQKQELASEMILDNMIANMANCQGKKLYEEVDNNKKDAFRHIGMNEQSLNWNDTAEANDGEIKKKADEAFSVISRNKITDFDWIMCADNGRQLIKDMYMNKIKLSNAYHSIVNARNKDEMIGALIAADKEAENGLGAIDDVVIPNVTRHTNADHKSELDEKLSAIKADMVDTAIKNGYVTDVDEYDFSDLSQIGVQKNANQIERIFKKIDDNDKWFSSDNYENMKTSLKNLRDFTKKCAKDGRSLGREEIEKYKELLTKTNQLADKYLVEKTEEKTPYARNRVQGVKDMKRMLSASLRSLDTAIEAMEKNETHKIFNDRYDLYDNLNPNAKSNNPFFGENYKEPESRKVHKAPGNSFEQEGVQATSLAICVLAQTNKYSFEDIMDPTKLQNEKKSAYESVITAMKNMDAPEQREWLSTAVYIGQKYTEHMMNQQIRNINFKDPNLLQNKNFNMLMHMYNARTETDKCMTILGESYENVARKYNTQYAGMEAEKLKWTPLKEIADSMDNVRKSALTLATSRDSTKLPSAAGTIMADGERMKHAFNMMEEKKKVNLSSSFNDWFSQNDMNSFQKYDKLKNAATNRSQILAGDMKMAYSLIPLMVDGKLMKKVKEIKTEQGIIFTGLPSPVDMKIEASNAEFLKKTDEALKRLEQENYPKNDKNAFIRDSAYAVFGQMYRISGGFTPIDNETKKKMSLEDFMKKQLKSGAFEKSLKSKRNPKQFTDPQNVASLAKNPAKIRHIMSKHTELNSQRLAQKNQSRTNSKEKNTNKKNIVKPEGMGV
ncbi:MAG: hypothetical protein K6B68_04245 [Eubacterium sp.]|nr:hypothetical protein [Eubacterium sp.]